MYVVYVDFGDDCDGWYQGLVWYCEDVGEYVDYWYVEDDQYDVGDEQ